MKKTRLFLSASVALGLAVAMALVAYICVFCLVMAEPRPIKNCVIFFTFYDYFAPQPWDTHVAKPPKPILWYPNVMGSGIDSLWSMTNNCRLDTIKSLAESYGYVPGLNNHDPEDLIMLYLKKPTKLKSGKLIKSVWKTALGKRKWAVLPHFIEDGHSDEPIRLDTNEFKQRLKKTLDFLKENNRPHWENIVKEHREFLNSIKE